MLSMFVCSSSPATSLVAGELAQTNILARAFAARMCTMYGCRQSLDKVPDTNTDDMPT